MSRRFRRPRDKGFLDSGSRGFGKMLLVGLALVISNSAVAGGGKTAPVARLQQEVEKAARHYLDAEVARDLKRVYASLYPASEYCLAKGFQAYVSEAQSSPVRITSYKILHIRIIPDNPEKEHYPNLEGFARVEVDVTIRYRDSGQESLVNYDFPFVRAGGKWYKL
jgi:hypothetical protein